MRLSRPRFTILTLMIVVLIASLVLTVIAVYRQRIRQTDLQSATAEYQNAKLSREVAEIAVLEYKEGIFKQDLDTVKGELALAESDLNHARDSSASDEKARVRVERAKEKLTLLEYTKSKTIKELQSEVEKARSDELAKKATVEQLKATFARQWW